LFCTAQRRKAGEKLSAAIEWLFLGSLFRHCRSEFSFQRPALSWGFRAFAHFLQANVRTALDVRLYVHYL